MPRSGGIYTLPPIYLAENGETIMPDQHNIPLEDVAQALTGSLPTDGTAPMQANIQMGGNKITGLGAATNPGDAVRFDQLPMLSPWLSSVSALTLAANEMVYASGPDTAAQTVITAAGRALLDDADAAAQRATLELGSLATVTPTGTKDGDHALLGDDTWGWSAEAVAEGAPDAPKIQGVALDTFIPVISLRDQTGLGWTGLDRAKVLSLCMQKRTVASASLRARFTNNGGSSWGAWQNMVLSPPAAGYLGMFLDLQTGSYYLSSPTAAGGGGGVLTVPSLANGVQFSLNVTSTEDQYDMWGYVMGGVSP